jgi:hypothetical protein
LGKPSVVFAIYTDSFLFVLATAILQFGFGVGYSGSVCESAILLCLVCYVTTKVSPVCEHWQAASNKMLTVLTADCLYPQNSSYLSES